MWLGTGDYVWGRLAQLTLRPCLLRLLRHLFNARLSLERAIVQRLIDLNRSVLILLASNLSGGVPLTSLCVVSLSTDDLLSFLGCSERSLFCKPSRCSNFGLTALLS